MPKRLCLSTFLLVLTFAVVGVFPPSAAAAIEPTRALLEGGLLEDGSFSEFSQTNALNGSLTPTTDRAYEGSRSAHATYTGAGRNGYSRGIWNVSWQDGDEVWYGGAFYLPEGFKDRMQGQVDLVRWDNWPSMPEQSEKGGVVIYGSDKRARLVRMKQGVEQASLGGSFDIPEGRWVWIEVHQRLSEADPLSEVYLDDELVASSTAKNSYGHSIDRIRLGLVAISSGSQTNPLELWFDRAAVSGTRIGDAKGFE
jgi:Polysaccharide lyase